MIEKLILISLGLIVALYAVSLANWPWVILGLMVAAIRRVFEHQKEDIA